MINDPVSLSELARMLGVNKSKLNFYAWKGLIKPVQVIGRAMLFEKAEVLETLKKIDQLQSSGKKLDEIIAILAKK